MRTGHAAAKPQFTIKKKIVIWFSVSLLVIEAIMLSLTFAIGQSVFNTDIQTQLARQVDANAQELEFHNTLEGGEIEQGDQYLSYKDGFLEIDDDFCDYISGIYTSLVDEDNTLLYGECPIYLDASTRFTFTEVGSFKFKGDRFYVYERPLHGAGLEGLWLRGVASQREGTNLLYMIMRLVILILPILAVISVLGGYLLTRRSLAPMDELVATAESIDSGDDLSRRIELRPGQDEVHQLAATFNNMLDRLEESFQREKQFTSDASHELRTPTSVILAQCEYSLELAETEEDYREALTVIQEQGLKMKELVSQLLFFSRLEQGSEPLRLADVNLSVLVEQVCAEQVRDYNTAFADAHDSQCNETDTGVTHFAPKHITLTTRIIPGITASVDSGLFTRLLTNLISNAYKYGLPGGHITVSLSTSISDSAILLSVSDDGIGIAPENLSKIWDRFYQVDPARSASEDAGGVGLGLAMVKEIAALHHGRMEVSSTPGEGTTFTLVLPQTLDSLDN